MNIIVGTQNKGTIMSQYLKQKTKKRSTKVTLMTKMLLITRPSGKQLNLSFETT